MKPSLFLRIFALTSLLLALVCLSQPTQAADLPAQIKVIQKRGKLLVGVKQDVPNFGYLDPKTETFSGMEVDLAKKIAKELKVQVQFVPVTAQTRGALVDNGQIDMAISTFTINPERKKLYHFSTPYYTDAAGFLVNKSSGYQSLKDLNGKTIGVAQGSNTRSLLLEVAKEHQMSFHFIELGSYPELSIALRAHRIDAFSVDQSILSGFVGNDTRIMDYHFKAADYGIATKKSNKDFSDYLSNLIEAYQKDGSLQKIYDHYHLKPVTDMKGD